MAASEFSSTENTCEGDNCEAITDVTYYVKEKKRLCKDCASKLEGDIMEERKGLSILYCEKHPDKDVEMYCKKHEMALCYICAVTDHKPCMLQDIADAVKEIKANLNGLKGKAKDKLQSCRDYRDQIFQCKKDSDDHLLAIKYEVDLTIQAAIKTDQDREEEDAVKIDQEIDEKNGKLQEKIQKLQEEIRRMKDEIRANNEEREKRHELNHTNAEKRREPMNYTQRLLHTDIQNIAQEIEKKIGELEKLWKDITKTTQDAIQTLDTVLEDDRNVIKNGHRVNTSVAEELDKPLDEGGVTHITHSLSGVRFVKGVGKKYDGRIDGYDGEWRLIDTINVRDTITFPCIVGCIDESNVIITDRPLGSRHTYMLDMNTIKHTQKVITASDKSLVTSCALLNDDKIVCGKYLKGCTGDSLTGCISVYDRQWKLINDVTIPRTNTTYDYTWVHVAADQDGMIIAAEWRQSKIYVINPADGKIIDTITYKENIRMFGVLSSGHIIVRPSPPDHRVFIIGREGNQIREIPHSDVIWNVCIDPVTDNLYVVTSDDEDKTCVIDQVMSGGDMMKRRVASFPLSTRLSNGRTHLVASRVIMTSSGKMIASDADNILVFKKMLTL